VPAYQTYQAKADSRRAKALAATTSPFTIEVRFLGGLTARQRAAFTAAADRWTRVIVGDLPSVLVDGEVIDNVLILAQGTAIDGPGRILGQAGPTHLRPASAGPAAFLTAKGIMSFDTADLAKMNAAGTLNDVIAHEMGHVLGIGTLWDLKDLLGGAGGSNPTFSGPGRWRSTAFCGAGGGAGECRSRTRAAPAPATPTGARRCSATN
jgi:predicted Zn-dependent protease